MAYTIKEKCAFLEALNNSSEPMRPADIGELIGISAFYAGQLAKQLRLSKLIEWASKVKHLHRITEKGKEYLANPPAEIEADKSMPAPPVSGTSSEKVSEKVSETVSETVPPQPPGPEREIKSEEKEDEDLALPSQADTFRSIGERLGFEKSVSDKRELSLRTVIDYVRNLADMDDLDSIERTLIELNVPKDIRSRWLKLYAQSLPAKGTEISPELKERLGLQEEEGNPARKREKEQYYNVVEGKIYPDPEGELTFPRALQQMAVERGASATQAAELSASLARAPTDIITALIPLLTKETPLPPPQDNTMVQVLQQRIEQLADDKHKAEMDSLRAEMRSGQRTPEADQQMQTLTQQINDLKENLHNEQLTRIQEQNQGLIAGLTGEMNKLKETIAAGVQGKQAETKLDLLGKIVDKGTEQLTGIRTDIKTMAPTFLGRGSSPKQRTPTEKAGFGTGLDKGIEKSKAANALEEELFFGKQS